MAELEFHPAANLFPLLDGDQFAELVRDVAQQGLKQPILVTADRLILDGRNRYRACLQAGVTPRFEQWSGCGSPTALVWSLNGVRRHLTASQRAALAVEMLPALEAEAKLRQQQHGGTAPGKAREALTPKVESVLSRNDNMAAAQAAKIVGAGRQYIADAKKLKTEAPGLFEKVKAGEKTITQAKREVKEQAREERREENRAKVEAVPDLAASDARFATILIDPPWDWGDEGDADQLGRARPQYATLSHEKLLALPVASRADIDCHLYLWITNRSLPKGFSLLEQWGFRYVTLLTWVKPSFGMGNYFRGQTEHVLFGVKGSQLLKRKNVGTVFQFPRGGEHSAKPTEFYDLVESCSPGPYLEIFARSQRPGWQAWGEVCGE